MTEAVADFWEKVERAVRDMTDAEFGRGVRTSALTDCVKEAKKLQTRIRDLERERDKALNLARHGACVAKSEMCKIAEAEARYWEHEAERCRKRGNQEMERTCRLRRGAIDSVCEKLRSVDANQLVDREMK